MKILVAYFKSAEVDNTIALNLYEKASFEKKEVFEYEVLGVKYIEFRMVLQL